MFKSKIFCKQGNYLWHRILCVAICLVSSELFYNVPSSRQMTLYSHLFSSELDETDLTEQETTDETGEDNCEKTCDLCLQMVRKMCNVSRVSRVRNHGKYNKCDFNREIEHFGPRRRCTRPAKCGKSSVSGYLPT